MKTARNRRLIILLLLFLCPFQVHSQFRGAVDKVKSHIMADPLTVSGSLGGSMTSSWNNADLHNTAPFSLTAYGNFNINIYGFSIPININFLDVSATQFTFPRPTFTINTTPTWKRFKFHLGTSSMNFSTAPQDNTTYVYDVYVHRKDEERARQVLQ